jgi:hypothetical protein
VTGFAGLGNGLASAAAIRARLLDGENTALHADLATAIAGFAGVYFPVFRTGTVTGFALDQGRDFNLLFNTGNRFFKLQFHHVTQIGSAPRSALGASTAEDITEDIAENVAHVGVTLLPATTHAMLEGGMTVCIIGTAFIAVAEHFIGLFGLFECLLGIAIARIAIRMVFHGQAPVGFFQIVIGRVFGDSEDLVKITLAHNWESDSLKRQNPRR